MLINPIEQERFVHLRWPSHLSLRGQRVILDELDDGKKAIGNFFLHGGPTSALVLPPGWAYHQTVVVSSRAPRLVAANMDISGRNRGARTWKRFTTRTASCPICAKCYLKDASELAYW